VGVRVLSDRGGTERVVGVVLSIPFGTDYRSARAATESANAAAAEAEAADVRRAIEQGAWLAVQAAQQARNGNRTSRRWLHRSPPTPARAGPGELGEAPLGESCCPCAAYGEPAWRKHRRGMLQAAMLVRIDAHAMWHSEGEGHGETVLTRFRHDGGRVGSITESRIRNSGASRDHSGEMRAPSAAHIMLKPH
jgi:hypothetical protein